MPTAAPGVEWTENSPDLKRSFRPLRELWSARELIGFFALRDLRVRYKQAVLGVVWAAAQPAAAVLVFTLVFHHVARTATDGIPYPVFAMAGLVTWTYFAAVVSQGSLVLVDNASLITKVHFPRLAAPASALLPPLVDLGVGLALLAVLAVVYRQPPTWNLLALPAWLLLLVVTALGVCLWLSALNVRYRDVKHALGPVMQLWLFASPVAYSSGSLPEGVRWVYVVNPVAGVVELGRWSLLGTPWPGWQLAVSVPVALALFLSGSWYFQRAERSFADVV